MTYNPRLVGITNTQDAKLRNILLDNMISFYNWGFLDKGGFTNITIPSSGMYGGDKHRLRPLNDPNYLPNQGELGLGNWNIYLDTTYRNLWYICK